MNDKIENEQYSEILRYIITEIKSTWINIAHRINSGMMQMYWNIGRRLSVEKWRRAMAQVW